MVATACPSVLGPPTDCPPKADLTWVALMDYEHPWISWRVDISKAEFLIFLNKNSTFSLIPVALLCALQTTALDTEWKLSLIHI